MNYKISVIMSVFNSENYLDEAIESILNQTYNEFEFIIVNDASSDNSLEIIKKYMQIDKRISLINNKKNLGLTKSLNLALKIAKYDFVARMDSDDISDIFRFEKQIEFFKQNKNYALVGTNIQKIDKFNNIVENNTTKYTYKDIKKTLKYRNCFAHGSVMINRAILDFDLKYDENFLYAQDYKLWCKIAKKYPVANLKEYLYKLRVHNSSISKKKIELQSIYAGIVAYEFENNIEIKDIKKEIENNKDLKDKIGKILLMNFETKIAKKYLSKFSFYWFVSYLGDFFNLKKIKNIIKRFK